MLLYFARLPLARQPYMFAMIRTLLEGALKRGHRVRLRVPDRDQELRDRFVAPYFSKEWRNAVEIEPSYLGIAHLPSRVVVMTAGVLDFWYVFTQHVRAGRPMHGLLWFQGFESEESYLKRASTTRRLVLSFLESWAIRFNKVTLVPSDAMARVLRLRYPMLREANIITLPNLVDSCPADVNKPWTLWGFRRRPALCLGYMGGMSVWQCFDETCQIVSEVQKRVADSWFLVLTPNWEQAQASLDRYGVRRYKVRAVRPERVSDYLAAFDLGFLLRRPHVVNEVSCPTKWLEYWRCGVPIVTTSAIDIVRRVENSRYKCEIDLDDLDVSVLKIVSFADNYLSQREHLRAELKEYVRKSWTWQAWQDKVELIFRTLWPAWG